MIVANPPLLARRLGALLAAASMASVVSYYAFDQTVAASLAGALTQGVKPLFRILSHLGDAGIYIVAGALLWLWARLMRTDLRVRQAGLLLMVGVAAGAGGAELLEYVLGRARPDLLISAGTYGFFPLKFAHHFNSFPSSHAAGAFAAATVLAFVWPRGRAAFFALAVLAGLSRVMLNAHFISDVIGGAFVGGALALVVCVWLARRWDLPAGPAPASRSA